MARGIGQEEMVGRGDLLTLGRKRIKGGRLGEEKQKGKADVRLTPLPCHLYTVGGGGQGHVRSTKDGPHCAT